jgi:hypothetical protein
VSGHAKIPPASHQVSATSLKLLIQQTHPHVRVERDSGMCVARDLYQGPRPLVMGASSCGSEVKEYPARFDMPRHRDGFELQRASPFRMGGEPPVHLHFHWGQLV